MAVNSRARAQQRPARIVTPPPVGYLPASIMIGIPVSPWPAPTRMFPVPVAMNYAATSKVSPFFSTSLRPRLARIAMRTSGLPPDSHHQRLVPVLTRPVLATSCSVAVRAHIIFFYRVRGRTRVGAEHSLADSSNDRAAVAALLIRREQCAPESPHTTACICTESSRPTDRTV